MECYRDGVASPPRTATGTGGAVPRRQLRHLDLTAWAETAESWGCVLNRSASRSPMAVRARRALRPADLRLEATPIRHQMEGPLCTFWRTFGSGPCLHERTAADPYEVDVPMLKFDTAQPIERIVPTIMNWLTALASSDR